MDYGRCSNIHIRYMEDFKIYIFVIQKSFLCNLGEISLVYNLQIEKKMWYLFDFFSNPMQCPFDVLQTILMFHLQKNTWSMKVLERLQTKAKCNLAIIHLKVKTFIYYQILLIKVQGHRLLRQRQQNVE